METATSKGAPSLWGPPNTVASFLLQAFACPAPWSPRYIPPGIRSRFISAGFPQRSPPLGTPEAGALGALGELLSDCTLTASDDQYKSILTFGSYDKFEKPDMVELLACITLIAVSPLTAQQLQLLIEKCLAIVRCRGVPGIISLQRLLGGGELSTLRNNRGHLIPFADHRSMQMIVTCAAILGVDFLTFPRKFCKSVNSGVTLMDLGVGGIIFTSGMVSSYAKGCTKKHGSLWASVSRAALHSGPLGIFGLIRLIFMSLTNLHVSETEYGLHWNFYMTLMVVFVFGELVCEYSGHPYKAGAVGLLLLVCYQIIISSADLDEWMMEGPRTNFFSSNREGIMGSIGFLCLFLMAVALGHFVITRVPTQQTKSEKSPKRLNLLSLVLHLYFFAFLFISFGLSLQEGFGLLARRRFVNLTWVAFVGGIELFAVATATLSDALAARVCPQWALCGTNNNQLIIFLLANFCVGAVNISIRTLLQPAVVVWLIMTSYMLFLFICAHRFGVSEARIRIL